MPRYDDQFEKMHKKRKGGGWNPVGSRRPPMNPQGHYSDILPRVDKDSQSTILGGKTSHHETLRSNIHVVVRIRPKNFNEKGPAHRTVVKAVGERVVIFDPKDGPEDDFYFHGIKQKVRHDYTKKPNKNLKFAYDRVYGPHQTNNEIFESSVKKLVSHIIDGFNCSIFAYGATGAGKTYTMLGSFEHPGLTFLMAMELYNRVNGMANEYESEIVVSYLEVYNETLRDLLHPSGILSIREDGFGVNIPNLTLHKPKDASELLGMLSYGNSCRTQHPTDHNAESSRSHAVFQVFVSLRKRFTHKSLQYKMAKAKLVMVDLAGSERGLLGPGCDSQRFREGANINRSLLALSNCINALADGKKHIPYRDSKLTRILKDSLGGNCRTVMIANVGPSQISYDDTYNTLKYAGRAKEIRVNCKKNFCETPEPGVTTYAKMVDELQIEIQQLKAELQGEREARKKMEGDKKLGNHHHNHHFHHLHSTTHHCESNSQISTAPLLTPTQVISDPVALENFIGLLSQKKKLEEDHTEASIASKELEWTVQWTRWKLELAKFAGQPQVAGRHNNKTPINSLQQMVSHYEACLARHKASTDKVNLTKQVLDFSDKEIDLVGGNCLTRLSMEDPFLTVTLREFLYYKSLERQVSAHKSLENYHAKMSLTIFQELISSETMLGQILKFNNFIYDCLQDRDGVSEYIEAKQNEILRPLLCGGDVSLKISSTELEQQSEFPSTLCLQALWEFMRNPVVEFEIPSDHDPDPDLTENHNIHEGEEEEEEEDEVVEVWRDLRGQNSDCDSHKSSIIQRSAGSSNDVLTLHHPKKCFGGSVESLFDRGVTRTRTVPFSAVPSDESVMTEDGKTRATTATDFEEAIKYSNSDLLEYTWSRK